MDSETVSTTGAAPDPLLPAFEAELFRRVPAEDLTPFDEAARAMLAGVSLHELRRPRETGPAAVSLSDVIVRQNGRDRELTVLTAINDDRPFLLDSTLAELVARGCEPLLVAHPILDVVRAEDGALASLSPPADGGERRESLIHVHLHRMDEQGERDALLAELARVYADVALVNRDAAAMAEQLAGLADEYGGNPPPLPPEEVGEAVAFLRWLGDGHFSLFGMRASRIPDTDGVPEPLAGSGLGLLADPDRQILKRRGELVAITPEIRAFLERPQALIVTKASVRSRVLSTAYLDYVVAKLFTPSGKLWGELAVAGLFTAAAYATPADDTPLLRRKIDAVLAGSGFDPASFDGRALRDVLEGFPRDELFAIDDETLGGFAVEMLRLREHPRIRVLTRTDRFGRYVSCLVFLPRDRDDQDTRERVGRYLAEQFDGRVSALYPSTPAGPLTRTHVIVGRDATEPPAIDRGALEAGIAAIVETWPDRLGDVLASTKAGPRGRALARRYAEAFGPAYRNAFGAAEALADVEQLERLSEARPRSVGLYRREGEAASRVNLKLFSRGAGLPLSERVPLLERMGFRVLDERTYEIEPISAGQEERTWLHDMALERATGAAIDIDAVRPRLEAALLAIFRGVAEQDAFNKLVLEAGLGWRDAAMVRALGRYLQQILVPYSQGYLADALARHGTVAAEIVALFYARFDPGRPDGRGDREAAIRAGIDASLEDVDSLDDDRILRRFVDLVGAAVRTNFFQIGPDGLPPPVIAFKFEARRVDEMPRPRPLYEIFMNGPQVEALHLRFGRVARGGLRWTDRPQDFRTEVLGLVKAQQVKNAVIVPVGAKGGFFPKRLPAPTDRAAWTAEGIAAYRTFVGTLLDITDNLDGHTVLPPPNTVRHDGDDPYLVVAADKGTATFSDIANAISVAHGHWLGDAFASGGSNGYDHKAMGITARGAWEAVKRHFREMDVDIGTEPVTVAGVGDMSGDVFGNGMLLSRSMKLVAAFDHRDIFIDPDPDPEVAWAERDRLFRLPRSSWQDYGPALISPGGGVFSRTAKSIPLSPEARAAIGLDVTEATPTAIMAAILRAPVGLLWFGGIGTYVRGSGETDATVGDRANDAIRITGREVRAKVIGEGANLGLTQRGRIEAALAGVRLNTDAIDNSAGVNTSDVEVNIKIALAAPERDGRLAGADRNALLAAMTDDVAALVLRNNYLQTLAISLSERRGLGDLGFMSRLMTHLEGSGRLDRGLEDLPDEVALTERRKAGLGLTRPELAILLAYAKLALYDELLASSVPDDPYLGRELTRYFPAELRERFPDAIDTHRLRREIISTQLANAIVNRGGPAVVTRLNDDTGADATTVAAAYAATRDSFGLTDLYAAIDALDGEIPGTEQLSLYGTVQELLLSRIVWFIRNVDFRSRPLDDVVGQFRQGIAELEAALDAARSGPMQEAAAERRSALGARGVPAPLAARLAALPDLVDAPDLVLVSHQTGQGLSAVAHAHFALGDLFRLADLVEAARAIPVIDHYDRVARDRAVDAVAEAHRRLTVEVLGAGGDLAAWQDSRGGEVERIRAAVDAIASSGLTVSKLTVAASLVGDLAKA